MTSPSPMLKTRDQRIVETLQNSLPAEAERLLPLRARALNLPAMLRRHGLMQVLLFLRGKRGDDRQLAGWLLEGILAATEAGAPPPDLDAYSEGLPSLALTTYLLHWEAAVEAATWLKLLVEARTQRSER